MTGIDVVYTHPGGRGWGQIERLAELAVSTFGGHLIEVDGSNGYTRLVTTRSLLPAPRRARTGRACLVIAPHPAHLTSILLGAQWRRRYSKIAGWVIDSFWVDRVPRIARTPGYYDQLYVTGHEDVDAWAAASSSPVSALPWGTDALNMPFVAGNRPVDLQRIGRQPHEWDDDDETESAAAALGMRFAGRPAFGSDDVQSRKNADDALANSKFTLAFSNLTHPSPYTHPTREYLTGRWMDALAAGATVAGIAPDTATSRELLWRDALRELPSVARDAGLASIRDALGEWSPAVARNNRRQALERLDWRHRLAIVRQDLDLDAPQLDAQLASVRASAADLHDQN